MEVVVRSVGLLAANCYVVYDESTSKAIVIDPGADTDSIISVIKSRGIEVEYILLTHGHFDHIGAVAKLKTETSAIVAIHSDDKDMLSDSRLNLASALGEEYEVIEPDLVLNDGDKIIVGEMIIKVIHTPGHTRGSIVFKIEDAIFSGDTLFYRSIGRSDLPGGNYSTLINSIKTKLYKLKDTTIVYPGHGEETNIGDEKNLNSFTA